MSGMRAQFTPHPSDPAIRLIQGRRSTSSKYVEAEITLANGVRKILSTKQHDLLRAAYAAVELKTKLLRQIEDTGSASQRKPHALGKGGPVVQDAADRVLASLDRRWETELRSLTHEARHIRRQKHAKFRGHRTIIVKHLLPALGNLTYREVTPTVVAKMLEAITIDDGLDPSNKSMRLTKAPAQSTIGSIAHTYGLVMRELSALSGETSAYPKITQRGYRPAEPRGSFSPNEAAKIAAAMSEDWIQDTKKKHDREIRRLLRAYVHLAATTGIRAGLEVVRLRAGQIQYETDSRTGHRYTRIPIYLRSGKGVVAREAIVNGLDEAFSLTVAVSDLTTVHGDLHPRTLLFGLNGEIPNYGPVFRALLDSLNLYREPGSNDVRALYSLRHYYANTMIAQGVEIYKLAKTMGTSTIMIEKHYGKALDRRAHAELAGVGRRQKLLRASLLRDKNAEDAMSRALEDRGYQPEFEDD